MLSACTLGKTSDSDRVEVKSRRTGEKRPEHEARFAITAQPTVGDDATVTTGNPSVATVNVRTSAGTAASAGQ
ncbi:hypothetical protein D3C87_1581940 [compost metagenome]